MVSQGMMFNSYKSIVKYVWLIVKTLPILLYNLLWPLMYINEYKRILSICVPNSMSLLSKSSILKIIFRNTACFTLSQVKKYLKLYIISAYMFVILGLLKYSNAIMVKSSKMPYQYSQKSMVLNLSMAD